MRKILFLDIDGTLVNYEGKLPASAAQAVQAARKNGHLVYLCSGRSKAEIYSYIWDIGVDGFIGGNGSYVEHQGQVILHQLITRDQCKRVVDWLHNRKLEFYLESNNGLFGSEEFETKGQTAVAMYAKRKGKTDAEQMTVKEAFPDMIFGGELYRDDLNKISYVLSTYQDHLDAKAAFPELQHGTWGGKGEEALFGDMGVKDITKANAVETLLNYLGADVKDTIAFGDAKVDIPMLEYCNLGVSMGNGGPEIKAMADMITDDVDADGLLHAFEKLELV